MQLTTAVPEATQSITLSIASRHGFLPDQIIPFCDLVDAISYLCTACATEGSSVWSAGHLFPDLEIGLDRAGFRAVEIIGESPFVGEIDTVFKQEIRPNDLLWVSNPNRITGSHFSVNEIERMAKLVPRGLLIVDEPYPSCFGISAASLLDSYDNIILVRPVDETSLDGGFFASSNRRMLSLIRSGERKLLSASGVQQIHALLERPWNETERIEQLYNESLRLALRLSRMQVRCWITATDFLLIRVGDPTGAGNHFAAHDVAIENLSGYPQLAGYLRYRIQSPQANERFLTAVERMSKELRITRPSDLFTTSLQSEANIESKEYLNRVRHIFDEQEEAQRLERHSVYAASEEL